MTLKVKNAGNWATVQNLYHRQNGVWVPVQKAFIKQAGVWVEAYAAEVVVTLSANINNVSIQNLFSAADWASTKKKRVVISATTIVGSVSPATPALVTGTGRGGFLQLDNYGFIHGAGGVPNSGSGGDAINVQQLGLIINNAGYIRGGGGAGGIGGTGGVGGTGYYVASEGPTYSYPNYVWIYDSLGRTSISWGSSGNVRGTSSSGGQITSYASGSYTYFRGSLQRQYQRTVNNSTDTYYDYSVSRQYNVYTGGAGGGAGGTGGYGQGSNQARTNGLGGAGGGNNGGNSGVGGTGGTGGAGGDWATPGSAGATGATGNAGNAGGGGGGYAGGGGGAAGRAITGLERTLNNTGTIQGAT
jgi:hypothetical protein